MGRCEYCEVEHCPNPAWCPAYTFEIVNLPEDTVAPMGEGKAFTKWQQKVMSDLLDSEGPVRPEVPMHNGKQAAMDAAHALEYIMNRYGSIENMISAMSVPAHPVWRIDREEFESHERQRLAIVKLCRSRMTRVQDSWKLLGPLGGWRDVTSILPSEIMAILEGDIDG